ncbi:MAG TPA: replication-associated recombination protein A [Candidatus Dojkabacteria bacterium]|nr:replication-associated recombination protein A [Candidatus Dojkabacteria bacterium]HQF37135.1 replication-associated recombination protein A [Candidatus Dojkabacteria bacterium]
MEPLASLFRPDCLENFIGQKHLIGPDGPIRTLIEKRVLPSMVFWGPPGTGKTTLAYIISKDLHYNFHYMSAVSSGKSKLLKLIKEAREQQTLFSKKTILFLDEIHRWNKAQQDALLPFVEKGTITLIGATTENPSFSLNSALLSRVKIFIFEPQTVEDITTNLERVINKLKEEKGLEIGDKTIRMIADLANGDVRSSLSILEIAISLTPKGKTITEETIKKAVQRQIYHDKHGEEHYNIISAIHKSLRSSNPDAACYWTMRMLEAGEDPRYIARRMVRFASEDIGNADPQALILAITVYNTVEKIGMPECDASLMQLAQYLAKAPKDNSAYVVAQKTREDVKIHGNLPVPLHLRNAETKLMKDIGYGKNYEYDHNLENKKSDQQCMPDKLKDRKYWD